MRYPVVLHLTEEGYSVRCPALSGCWSQGATEQEALVHITEAIEDCLAVKRDEAMARSVT